MGYCSCDRAGGIVRCSFTRCPDAEFAKRHRPEDVLPFMRCCERLAMQKLHAAPVREGSSGTSECCDHCIVGDRDPLAANCENVKNDQGPIISRKKIDPERSRK